MIVIHSENDSRAVKKWQLAPGDGVFELAGSPPTWIGVYTCPTPECACRSALILAAHDGREKLIERTAIVRDAWNSGSEYSRAAAALDDLIAFHIDIDSAEISSLNSDTPLDLQAHPRIADIAGRIDGDLLDTIGSRWYRGKGWLDPEQRARDSTGVRIKGWQPGDMVAWNDISDVRQDLYVLQRRVYEAADMYCLLPSCECGEVLIEFETRVPRGAPSPGHVIVRRSGVAQLEPNKKGGDRLEQLWSAFKQRHPNYLARFTRRYPIMKGIGERSTAASRAVSAKIGRNDSCPCGSGKKYKRCCGSK
jgi:hypothetical protein